MVLSEDDKFFITGGVLGLVLLLVIVGMIVVILWIKNLSGKINVSSETSQLPYNDSAQQLQQSYNNPESPQPYGAQSLQPITPATDKYMDYKIRRAQLKNDEGGAVPTWMNNDPPRLQQQGQNIPNNNWLGNEQQRLQAPTNHGYPNAGGNLNRNPMQQQNDRPAGRPMPSMHNFEQEGSRFGRY